MSSLKHQIVLLMIGSLVLLATSFIFVFGWYMRERVVDAAIVKAKSDLATCMEIIDLTYIGYWQVKDGMLYKGENQISHQTELVDRLAELTGDTITLFLKDIRVATTVRSGSGERAIGTKVSDSVAKTVLKDGQIYLGEANVVGHLYQTAYQPIRDLNGVIIGIFYVGISKDYAQTFIVNSLIQLAIFGLALTLIVVFMTWLFIQKMIIRPLHEITLGTRDVATGHATEKIDVTGPKEIGELTFAFNQMIERLGSIADEMSQASVPRDVKVKNASPVNSGIKKEEPDQSDQSDQSEQIIINTPKQQRSNGKIVLPKGLNQLTLKQIVSFLHEKSEPVSADNVAEGVNLTRVTVRRYLDFLEQYGVLTVELKYGTVGRPVKLFRPIIDLSSMDIWQ